MQCWNGNCEGYPSCCAAHADPKKNKQPELTSPKLSTNKKQKSRLDTVEEVLGAQNEGKETLQNPNSNWDNICTPSSKGPNISLQPLSEWVGDINPNEVDSRARTPLRRLRSYVKGKERQDLITKCTSTNKNGSTERNNLCEVEVRKIPRSESFSEGSDTMDFNSENEEENISSTTFTTTLTSTPLCKPKSSDNLGKEKEKRTVVENSTSEHDKEKKGAHKGVVDEGKDKDELKKTKEVARTQKELISIQKESIKQQQKKMENIEKERKCLEEKLKKVKEENNKTVQELDTVTKHTVVLRDQNKSLRDLLHRKQSEQDGTRRVESQTDKEKEDLRKEVSSLKESVKGYEAKLAGLLTEVMSKEKVNIQLCDYLDTVKNMNKKLEMIIREKEGFDGREQLTLLRRAEERIEQTQQSGVTTVIEEARADREDEEERDDHNYLAEIRAEVQIDENGEAGPRGRGQRDKGLNETKTCKYDRNGT